MSDKKPHKRLHWYAVRPGFVVLILILSAACYGLYRNLSLPTGSGPAGGSVEAAAFSRVRSEEPVLLVGMGDSVVTGFGARKGYGFFDLLSVQPPDDDPALAGRTLRAVYPSLRVKNLAENSSSSGEHLRQQLLKLPVQDLGVKGLVILSTGGIDLIHDYGSSPPRDEAVYGATWADGERYARLFRGRLEKLLDGIATRFPAGCDIYIATIFDPTDGIGDIENVSPVLRAVKPLPAWPDGLRIHGAFNQHIREAAAARSFVHVVDVHALMLGHGLHCRDKGHPNYHAEDPSYWYYFNLEDPNERGYDAIRREFLRVISRGW